jgi:hypothetical protein
LENSPDSKGCGRVFIGPPEDAHQTEFLFGVLQFLDGARRILQRNERDSMETFWVVATVVGEPAIVGAADGRTKLRVEIVAPHDVETESRKKNAYVDALAVHVAHV